MSATAQALHNIWLPKGFSFSAVAAGLKASARLDLGLVVADRGTTAAAVFTRNRVAAAPVQMGRAWLASTRGHVQAVLVNAGNANCATGAAGLRSCKQTCREAARLLRVQPEQVFPSSTGIIGVPLPAEKIIAKLPTLVAASRPTEDGVNIFAQAIMTTDTRPKIASARLRAGKQEIRLLGIAKGSGMIHPQLATMLVYLFTDLCALPSELRRALHAACDQTFNCISVDGDTSTNDTVLLLASGQSGVRLRGSGVSKFSEALLRVCRSLCDQIVSDGEGVQHVVHLLIEEARDRAEALHVARAIAHSALVKTAWAGADPNWGRILAAVGYSGVTLDPQRVSIWIGQQQVCRNGAYHSFDIERAHGIMSQREFDVRVKLGRGRASAPFTTTDLTADYVRINADYST